MAHSAFRSSSKNDAITLRDWYPLFLMVQCSDGLGEEQCSQDRTTAKNTVKITLIKASVTRQNSCKMWTSIGSHEGDYDLETSGDFPVIDDRSPFPCELIAHSSLRGPYSRFSKSLWNRVDQTRCNLPQVFKTDVNFRQ